MFADTGWQEYASLPAKKLLKVPNLKPMTHLLSVYGVAGLTAYFGLLDVGKPKEGESGPQKVEIFYLERELAVRRRSHYAA